MLVNVHQWVIGENTSGLKRLQGLRINVSGRGSQIPGGTSPSRLEVGPRGRVSPVQTQQMGLPRGQKQCRYKAE